MRGKKQPKPLTCTKIVLDSGPLLVLLCGSSGTFDDEYTKQICSNEKEAEFYEEHGEQILKIVAKKEVFITPHVVAEVSNKIKSMNIDVGRILSENNAVIKHLLSRGKEQHIELKELLGHRIFKQNMKFGITDCGLMMISDKTTLLLTHDRELRDKAKHEGIDAMLPQEMYYSVAGYKIV
jgi:rRNA-processing protein FCF1